MKLFIFCVRDRATDAYGNPMFLVSAGQAVRSFTDEINRPSDDNMLYKHPDDFDLFHLGEFDTQTAVFALLERPEQIAIGKMVKVRS